MWLSNEYRYQYSFEFIEVHVDLLLRVLDSSVLHCHCSIHANRNRNRNPPYLRVCDLQGEPNLHQKQGVTGLDVVVPQGQPSPMTVLVQRLSLHRLELVVIQSLACSCLNQDPQFSKGIQLCVCVCMRMQCATEMNVKGVQKSDISKVKLPTTKLIFSSHLHALLHVPPLLIHAINIFHHTLCTDLRFTRWNHNGVHLPIYTLHIDFKWWQYNHQQSGTTA